MITNPKIERKKADITRTEEKLTEVRVRLKQQKDELTKLEDEEIVALFRNEIITEDDFATLLRSRRESAEKSAGDNEENGEMPQKREEKLPDVLDEN